VASSAYSGGRRGRGATNRADRGGAGGQFHKPGERSEKTCPSHLLTVGVHKKKVARSQKGSIDYSGGDGRRGGKDTGMTAS